MKHPIPVAAALFVVAFFGWCAVPASLHARNRSRQVQTIADIRSIAAAWEARASDINSYSVGVRKGTRITTADLARALEPNYIRHLPRRDGWGSEFEFTTSDEDSDGHALTYFIRSLGSDRRRDRLAMATGPTRNSADDIIYSNGSFIRYPEASG